MITANPRVKWILWFPEGTHQDQYRVVLHDTEDQAIAYSIEAAGDYNEPVSVYRCDLSLVGTTVPGVSVYRPDTETAKAEGESPQAQPPEADYDGPEDEVREVNEDKVRERQPEERQP